MPRQTLNTNASCREQDRDTDEGEVYGKIKSSRNFHGAGKDEVWKKVKWQALNYVSMRR